MKNTIQQRAQGYDLIGDIHGHAGELTDLLSLLGYERGNGTYSHPKNRKVIFLGDYIDRGPRIREVLETVRGMMEGGSAFAILGNHEVNAMRFHATGSDGNPLRPHTKNNVKQHRATLEQFPDRKELAEWLHWFSSLPLFLECDGLRAVHACWDDEAIAELNCAGRLVGETLERFSRKGSAEYEIMSRTVNGPEALLPVGYQHETADSRMRSEFRVKWWVDLQGLTCREAIFPDDPVIPHLPLRDVPLACNYPTKAPVTFFGHYALKGSTPKLLRPNLACLDYGMGKGGFLCAYRWDGESSLDERKFIRSSADFHKRDYNCPLELQR